MTVKGQIHKKVTRLVSVTVESFGACAYAYVYCPP